MISLKEILLKLSYITKNTETFTVKIFDFKKPQYEENQN